MSTKYYDAENTSTPGDITVAGNWDGNALPGANDDVRFDANEFVEAVSALTGDLSATALDTVYIGSSVTQTLGSSVTSRLKLNAGGTSGNEISDYSSGSKYCHFTGWQDWSIFAGGTMYLSGTGNASASALNISASGTVYIGTTSAYPMKVDDINLGGATATVGRYTTDRAGTGNPNIIVSSGTVYIYHSVDSLTVHGGTVYLYEGGVTTLTIRDGTVYVISDGTIGTLTATGGTIDWSDDSRSKTVTNCTIGPGVTLDDPQGVVTFTNGITLSNCKLSDVTLDIGTGKTITIS